MTDEKERTGTPAETGTDDVDTGEERFDAVAAVAELEAAMKAAEEAQAQAQAQGSSGGSSDRYIEMLESDLLELNALVEAKDAALARAEARVEKAQDEIERAKVRLSGESKRQLELRARKILLSFVEVLDELDRALTSVRDTEHHSELVTGVERVHRRFLATLEAHGVRHLPALGEPFDPTRHDAVTTTTTTDPGQDGRVIAVMREGYIIGEDELLRPAAVVVGKLINA
jgi:molecular chaperone GrpE